MDENDAEKSFEEILRTVLEQCAEAGHMIDRICTNLQKVAGADALAIWQGMNDATEDDEGFCKLYRSVYIALRKGIASHNILDWLSVCKQDATYSILHVGDIALLMHGMEVM